MSPMRLLLLLCLASAGARAEETLTFAVNEGVTYRITVPESRERFKGIADAVSAALKRPVRIEPVDDYGKLRAGLAQAKYDLAFVHPTHVAAQAIRDHRYRLVALLKGYTDYRARLLVPANSPVRAPPAIAGKRIAMPSRDSITAVLTRATLRDLGVDPAKQRIDYTRYQDAVPFMLENGFDDVGSVGSAAVAREWQKKGGIVLLESRPVPVKLVIASPAVSAAEVERLRAALTALDKGEGGRRALEKIDMTGFVSGNEQEILELLKWMGV